MDTTTLLQNLDAISCRVMDGFKAAKLGDKDGSLKLLAEALSMIADLSDQVFNAP